MCHFHFIFHTEIDTHNVEGDTKFSTIRAKRVGVSLNAFGNFKQCL